MSDKKVTSIVLGPNGPVELDNARAWKRSPSSVPTTEEIERDYQSGALEATRAALGLPGTNEGDITNRYARGEQPSLFHVDDLAFIKVEPGQSGDLSSSPENLERAREVLGKDEDGRQPPLPGLSPEEFEALSQTRTTPFPSKMVTCTTPGQDPEATWIKKSPYFRGHDE